MDVAAGLGARGRHREPKAAAPTPAARWALMGTLMVAAVAVAVTAASQIVSAYHADPERGAMALAVVGIGVLGCSILALAVITVGAILQRVRVARVRRETRDLVYFGRALAGFDAALHCFSGRWPSRDSAYCFSIGSSGIRFWAGLREPVMVAAIHWSAIESVHLERVDSRTSTHWSASVVASANPSTPLPLVPVEWLSGTLGKRRATRVLHQLRWHLARRDNY